MLLKVRVFHPIYLFFIFLGGLCFGLYDSGAFTVGIYKIEGFRNSICCVGILFFVFSGLSLFSNYLTKQRYLDWFNNGDCIECEIVEKEIFYDYFVPDSPISCRFICSGRDAFGEYHTFKSHIFSVDMVDKIEGQLYDKLVKVYLDPSNSDNYFVDIPITLD